jgi:Rho-binding antiterminator
MSHVLERCDVIDVLEEAVTLKRPLTVELAGGKRFVDRVRDVVTEDGQDWAVFDSHERMPVNDIRFVAPAEPHEPSYAGKPLASAKED